jgi:hypothetical protein
MKKRKGIINHCVKKTKSRKMGQKQSPMHCIRGKEGKEWVKK